MAGHADPVARWVATMRELESRFTSRTRDTAVTARLGIALGIAFLLCFVTGLVSHFLQHPPAFLAWPSRPIWFYR